MEQKKEAIYLINDERYLHLRENGAGVGFATYNKVTGEPLESGQISEKNLPPDGRNMMSAARNWYLFELSDDDRKAIQLESVKILETIPQAGIGRRRIWEPETIPPDIRLINSYYDDLHRVPDGGVIQVDYPDGRSFTSRLEYLDDYHFDMGGLGNVFHICQFAEVMERNGADYYPEIQTQDEQGAWELGGKGYLAIQSTDEGWNYTIYHSDFSVMDGGQVDAPELTIQEVREQILEAHHMEKGRRLLQDYDFVMDRAAEAEKLGAYSRAQPLINKQVTCYEANLRAYLKLAYYAQKAGKPDIAADMCTRAEEALAGREKDEYLLLYMGLFIAYYLMTNPERGWEYAERCIDWSLRTNTLKKYRFSCDMVEALKYEMRPEVHLALPEEFPLYRADGVYSVSELRRYFYQQAEELAQRYDARNGNSGYMDRLKEIMSN